MTKSRLSHFGFQLSDEARLTLLLCLFSFFVTGIPRVFTSTATHTLLLDRYGAEAMPLAYILQAILIPLGGYFYVRFEGRVKLRTLIFGTLVTDLLVLAGLWAAYQVPGLEWVAFAGIVWFEVEFALVSLMLWGMASQLMTLRQGKRLFGIIGSGEPTAVIIGGLATPMLLTWLKPADLLWMSGLGIAVGLGVTLLIFGRFTPQREQENEEAGITNAPAGSAISGWWRAPYIRILVTVVFFSQLVYFLTDFAFYERANARFPNENELAAFLGMTQAVIGVLSLVTGLLISAPLVSRFGLRNGLLVLPVLLMTVGMAVVVAGHSIGVGNGEWLFWLVVGGKVIDQSLRYTLDKTSSVTLFQPFPAAKRNGLQAAMESMVEPLSGGIAGVILYVLAQWAGFTAFGISHAILVAALVWATCIFAQHKGYLLALREALANRGLGGIDLDVSDEESIRVLRQGVNSKRVGEALYCVNLLAERGQFDLPLFSAILSHPEAEVRMAGINQAEITGLLEAAPLLQSLLMSETEPKVIGAALRAYAATGATDAADRIAAFLTSTSLTVRLDAFAALMRHGGIEGMLAAGGRFLDLLNSSLPEDRQFAAQIIERTAMPQFRRPLAQLLSDPDVSVRLAALRAAGNVCSPELWPLILDALSIPGCEQAARMALVAGGEASLPIIDDFIGDTAAPQASRAHAITAIGLIGGPLAGRCLVRHLGAADRALRRVMLRMLNQCQHHCSEESRPEGLRLLKEEVNQAALLAAAHADLAAMRDDASIELVRRSLASEIEQRQESVAHLLGYLSQSGGLDSAWQLIRFGSQADGAYLAEAIEHLVPRELKSAVLGLLESPQEQRHAALLRAIAQPNLTVAARLRELGALPSSVITPWMRACIIFATVQHTEIDANWLHDLPPETAPFVTELHAWASARLVSPA
ncbi:Npt1/Npt2 family nucleotide transporter [Rhodoferax sp.]|uniref:Npt1/Npt2 family nucleotide transporter n=1 Tax=Rhodoferax sp. TaxID=50421 RepID=UPI0025DDF7DA|nr:Npt1/Npt2 family nucleotide transporter [Rhodoferax sp.]